MQSSLNKWGVVIALILSSALPSFSNAQVAGEPEMQTTTESAVVIRVISETEGVILGTDVRRTEQLLEAEILSGERRGLRLQVENDYVPVTPGTRFMMVTQTYADGASIAYLQDVDRRGVLALITLGGVLIIVAFSGLVGLRSLLSLGVSVAIIIFVLLPLLLAGFAPVPTAVGVSAFILAGVMYATHGNNRTTHAAFLGTLVTIILTGIIATIAVSAARLSGFSADESVYLNISVGGALDMSGLLLSAIIIGVLGILDDIAITQAATVGALRSANAALSRRELYRGAMQVGREHVGALVNTLALAYAGASLPLLLLIARLDTPLSVLINQEIFATEIVRTVIGTAALTLAVPLSTLFAIYLGVRMKGTHQHSHNHE